MPETSASGTKAGPALGGSKNPNPPVHGTSGGAGVATSWPGAGGDNPGETASATLDKTKKTQFVASELKRMRYFRRQYDIRRAHFYRQYLGQRDERTYPDNVTKRSNAFWPYPFSNTENLVARVMDAFFSMEEWFEIKEKPPYSDEQAADAMQMALNDKLHRAKFPKAFEELVRNIIIYGNSAMKVDWNFGFETVIEKKPIFAETPVVDPMNSQPVIDPTTSQPQTQPMMGPDGQPIIQGYQPVTKQIPKQIPRFTIIDVYDFLIDPDGAYRAHLTERTWQELQDEFKANPDMYFADGMTDLGRRLANEENPGEIIIRLAEFWNENDNTWTIMTFGEDPEGISFKDLRASFRATAYSPYKRRIYGGETIMLWDGPNPFSHKQCPLLWTDFIKLPGEIFGLGAIEIITDLSEQLNRFYNMVADNWNLGINKRYVYDINAEIDHDSLNSFNVPGGKIGIVGDPTKSILPLESFTPSAQDYQIMEVTRAMIEMASGVSDFYDRGMGGSKGNKTASGINQILQETNFRIKGFLRNLELDILQPMLEMCASMVQQFVQEPFGVPNPNAGNDQPAAMMVDPAQLIGTYQYDIVAANYATNKMVRQRNMMALAKVLENNPYIDPYTATRELLKTFDLRHVDQLMKTPQQVEMEQQQQMQQQLQMMLLQHQLETDQKVKVAEAEGGPEGPPGSKGKGGKSKKGQPGKKSKAQFEGQIPGAGTSSAMRDVGSKMGLTSLGLGQMGDVAGM